MKRLLTILFLLSCYVSFAQTRQEFVKDSTIFRPSTYPGAINYTRGIQWADTFRIRPQDTTWQPTRAGTLSANTAVTELYGWDGTKWNVLGGGGGGGGGITQVVATNGLTNVNDSTIKWGGTLTENTTITGGAFGAIIGRTSGTAAALAVSYTSASQAAIQATNISGDAINASGTIRASRNSTTSTNYAMSASNTQGTSLNVTGGSATLPVAKFIASNSIGAGIPEVLHLEYVNSGPAEALSGITQTFTLYQVGIPTANAIPATKFLSRWDASSVLGDNVSELVISGADNETAVDILTLNATAAIKFNQYTTGNFYQNDTSSYKPLMVDASGSIFRGNWFGGGGGADQDLQSVLDEGNSAIDQSISLQTATSTLSLSSTIVDISDADDNNLQLNVSHIGMGNGDGTRYAYFNLDGVKPANMTTTQRDAMVADYAGDIIWNETTEQLEYNANPANTPPDWQPLGGGGGGNTIYTADDALLDNRTVDLNGNVLQFQEGSDVLLGISPTDKVTLLRATDGTSETVLTLSGNSAGTTAFGFTSSNGTNNLEISADADDNSITHTAALHSFIGGTVSIPNVTSANGINLTASTNSGFIETVDIDNANGIRMKYGNTDVGGGMRRNIGNNAGELRIYSDSSVNNAYLSFWTKAHRGMMIDSAGEIFMDRLTNAISTNVLTYNTSTKKVTYGLPGVASGTGNTGIGTGVLAVNAASHNSAFGFNAMPAITSGGTNVAIGSYAMGTSTTAENNVAIGVEAMYGLTSGFGNVGIGASALYTVGAGSNNMAIGYSALKATTGSNNTAMGYDAVRYPNVNNVTAVGYGALRVGGSNSTGIGLLAGSHSTGTNNVFIGASAGSETATFGNTTGSNNMALGTSARLLWNESDAANIFNTIFIDVNNGADSTASTTSKVGINKITPTATFDVNGNVNIGNASAAASAILGITSTTQGFLPPRMTATQASAISSPAEGLLVYVTDTNGTFTAKGWWGYDGAAWQKLNN